MTTAPTLTAARRDDLFRLTAAAGELRIAGNGDGRRFTGYGIKWNSPTVIDTWEGHFVEQFAPGSLTKTITERGDRIPILYDHGFDPSIGNKPVASAPRFTIDDTGLRIDADMIDRPYADDITEAVRAGAIAGMSVRFSLVGKHGDEWDREAEPPIRTIREAKLHEVSIVTFPAYEATTAGVRSAQAYQLIHRGAAPHGTPTDHKRAASGTHAAHFRRVLEARQLIGDPQTWVHSQKNWTG